MNKEICIKLLLKLKELILPPDVWNKSNILRILEKYGTVKGLFMGVLLVVLVYFALYNDSLEKDDSHVLFQFLQLMALFALINSLNGLDYNLVMIINQRILKVDTNLAEKLILGAFNPTSIFILCIVIKDYKGLINDEFRVFFIAVSNFSISIILSGEGAMTTELRIAIIIRVILAGILCSIINSKFQYVFSAYIALSIYFILSEAVIFGIRQNYFHKDEFMNSIKMVLKSLVNYGAEYIAIGAIAIIWEILELCIIPEKTKASA